MASCEQRLQALQQEIFALNEECKKNEAMRKKLLATCQMSVGVVATPTEQIWQMLMQPHAAAAIRTCLDLGIFDILSKSAMPVTATVLAKATRAENLVVIRLLRPLCALHVVIETDLETYASGPVSKALSERHLYGSWNFMHDEAGLCALTLPEYLKSNDYKNPDDPSRGNWQYSHKTDLPMFPWMAQCRPQQLGNFFDMLEGWRLDRKEWFDVYPVAGSLMQGFEERGTADQSFAKTDPALLVDIGGGVGYDLQNFRRRFAADGHKLPGKLVLQDLPPVIDEIKELDEDIVRVKHDFFTTQPVKGARAYYMHFICHDWSDQRTHDILSNIAEAMTPEYSRLLINDHILPDVGAAVIPSLLDVNMMILLSGMERTESQWKALIGGVHGLEIRKFWKIDGDDVEGLVECVRVE